MQIFVRTARAAPSGGTLALQVQPSDTVASVKAQVQAREGVGADDFALSYGGKPLACGRALCDYDVHGEATLQMALRLRGGAQLGKSVKGKSKGKDKKGKKPKDGEESALRDRIRMMEEQDLARRKAAAAREALAQKMRTEQKNTRVNQLKIQNQWRKIMRLAKVESLRKDIEILSQSHERDVDRKDAIIQMLDRDLEEAEEQYTMALRSHLQNIDGLIDLQDQRLLSLENEFEHDLHQIESEFSAEGAAIEANHKAERQELRDIMAAFEAQELEAEADAKQDYESMREMVRNKNMEDINVLRITLESTIDELERHFESAHLNYLQNTDQRTQDFKFLTRNDQELSKDIETKLRQIDRLQSSITHWRTKTSQNMQECNERNKLLRGEKEAINKHFQQLKSRMNRFRDGQSRRLAELTHNVRDCKSHLGSKKELAERILSLSELARKMETEREKVLPHYTTSVGAEVSAEPPADVKEGIKGADEAGEEKDGEGDLAGMQAHGIDASGKSVEEWNYLDMFWKKYNKVLLDKLAIDKERDRLRKENTDLQAILKQYLDGISVNEDVMVAPNPLLVVNGRVNLNAPPVRRAPGDKLTVIEGNQMVSTGRAR